MSFHYEYIKKFQCALGMSQKICRHLKFCASGRERHCSGEQLFLINLHKVTCVIESTLSGIAHCLVVRDPFALCVSRLCMGLLIQLQRFKNTHKLTANEQMFTSLLRFYLFFPFFVHFFLLSLILIFVQFIVP